MQKGLHIQLSDEQKFLFRHIFARRMGPVPGNVGDQELYAVCAASVFEKMFPEIACAVREVTGNSRPYVYIEGMTLDHITSNLPVDNFYEFSSNVICPDFPLQSQNSLAMAMVGLLGVTLPKHSNDEKKGNSNPAVAYLGTIYREKGENHAGNIHAHHQHTILIGLVGDTGVTTSLYLQEFSDIATLNSHASFDASHRVRASRSVREKGHDPSVTVSMKNGDVLIFPRLVPHVVDMSKMAGEKRSVLVNFVGPDRSERKFSQAEIAAGIRRFTGEAITKFRD